VEVERPCVDNEKSKVVDEKENQLPSGTQDKKQKRKRKLINQNVSDCT